MMVCDDEMMVCDDEMMEMMVCDDEMMVCDDEMMVCDDDMMVCDDEMMVCDDEMMVCDDEMMDDALLNAAMTWMKNKISVLKSSQNAYQATVVAYTLAKSSASPSDANYKAARDLLDAVDSWAGTPEPAGAF
ncbi:hypothetical protein DPMN_178352 [Dreissena polymorpha]|uniref:Uncharacterized protein n=1 Tax=Dreissena polymorpha TaxID=45954 RepID=A0A9D4EC12_DREPO|nr:hypothetical protein DPMN_178352 [Dreissena polymorpha]